MRILLFSNLYAPEPTGVGPYSAELAGYLAARGHQVAVIAANPSYPHWRLHAGFRPFHWSRRDESGVAVHRVPVYVPAKPSGLSRIAHYLSFVLAAVPVAIRTVLRLKPDAVILVAPTLLAAPVVLVGARMAGALSWLHVQDFEVEAAFATDQMGGGGLVARAALAFERWCLRSFSKASSISPNMCAKLVEKGVAPTDVFELRNWAGTDIVATADPERLRRDWGISTTDVVLYAGSIAAKQGIDIVVDVARLLRDRDVTLLVCGNGPNRAALEGLAAGVPNIRFHDLQPREALGDLLALATIHLLPQKRDAADLVLPSKLTNMLASARPVVATADPGTSLAIEVDGCGLVVPPEDPQAIANAIATLIDDHAAARRFGEAARLRAEEHWSKTAILSRFEGALVAAVAARQAGR